MHLLLADIFNNNYNGYVDEKFVKNKYSKLEYLMISYGLKKFYNIDSFDIYYSKNGKPYLRGLDIYISISHDRNLVCVAFNNKNIGVDLQFISLVKGNFREFLELPLSFNNDECLIEFSKREAIIKLLDKTISEINVIRNYSDIKYILYKNKKYILSCVIENRN